jgi:hypothetical protein
VQDFCSRKAAAAASSGSTEESETWTFMGVLFEDDARRQLLAKLGFSEAMLPQTASATAAAGDADLPGQSCQLPALLRWVELVQPRWVRCMGSGIWGHLSKSAGSELVLQHSDSGGVPLVHNQG